MFPLEAAMLPGEELPLRIFEPRYSAMISDCLAGTGEFGVVLIQAGREVGGGDVRSDVGALARIVEHTDLLDFPGARSREQMFDLPAEPAVAAPVADQEGIDKAALADEFGEDTAVRLLHTLARVAELPVPGR